MMAHSEQIIKWMQGKNRILYLVEVAGYVLITIDFALKVINLEIFNSSDGLRLSISIAEVVFVIFMTTITLVSLRHLDKSTKRLE